MPACAAKPENCRRQIQLVGNDLVQHYGKKKFYSVVEVKQANRRQNIDLDVGCWSHAFFNSHEDFDAHHAAMGETCDYLSMKQAMLESVSTAADSSLFDFDLSWLEFPDLDFSIFDFFDLA